MKVVITNAGDQGPEGRKLKYEFCCYSCRVRGEKEMSLDPDHDARQMAEVITFFFLQQHSRDYPQCDNRNIKVQYRVLGKNEDKGVIKVDTLDRGIWGIR